MKYKFVILAIPVLLLGCRSQSVDLPSVSKESRGQPTAKLVDPADTASQTIDSAAKLTCDLVIYRYSKELRAEGAGGLIVTREHPLRIALAPPDTNTISEVTGREGQEVAVGSVGWRDLSLGLLGTRDIYTPMDPTKTKLFVGGGQFQFTGAVTTKGSVVIFTAGEVTAGDPSEQASSSTNTMALLDGVPYKFNGKIWEKVPSAPETPGAPSARP